MQAALTSTWIVSGYGTTSRGADSWGQGGAMAAKLQYGELKYVDPNTCQQAVGRVDPDSMVCALGLAAVGGGAPPVQDSCQGDSGGPLFFNTKAPSAPMSGAAEDDRLVGAVSWGNGCGQRGAPGVYSNIPKLSAWVNQQLAENPSLCDGPLPPAGGGGGGGGGGLDVVIAVGGVIGARSHVALSVSVDRGGGGGGGDVCRCCCRCCCWMLHMPGAARPSAITPGGDHARRCVRACACWIV
jgi:hypothetical protein